MTRYRLLAPSIVNNTYCEAGSEVDIDYLPGPQMEPIDAEGRRQLDEFRASRTELEPDYPNFGWPLIDKYWFGSLVRERLREMAQERRQAEASQPVGASYIEPSPPEPPPPERPVARRR